MSKVNICETASGNIVDLSNVAFLVVSVKALFNSILVSPSAAAKQIHPRRNLRAEEERADAGAVGHGRECD
ncbi:hypothetical protein NNO04_19545 [Citrobacter sp. Awk 4]|uniref:hypothetical protein n=1 Tax=Citrobacter sp. Awk 4 TaxID=2963955 RepID=UPI0023044E73|nr:hypothetical protein [Citrobacter sp. Awk 4]MDA8480882.1 hypothetical protein [Citrobacter sp. Awk 4]